VKTTKDGAGDGI